MPDCVDDLTSTKIKFIHAWLDQAATRQSERPIPSAPLHNDNKDQVSSSRKRTWSQRYRNSEFKMATPPSSVDGPQVPVRTRLSRPKSTEDTEDLNQEDTPRPPKRSRGRMLAGESRVHEDLPLLTTSPSDRIQSPSSVYPQSSASRTSSPALRRLRYKVKSRSPVKKHQLRWLSDKPIDYRSYAEARNLIQFKDGNELAILNAELAQVHARGNAFLPRQLRAEIVSHLDRNLGEDDLEPSLYDDPRPIHSLQQELSEILSILEEQQELDNIGGSEAEWGERVWSRIIRLATSSSTGVNWRNVTTARIEKAFVPHIRPRDNAPVSSSGTSDLSCASTVGVPVSKMVDYAIVITSDKQSQAAIERFVAASYANHQPATINQTSYYSLAEQPIAISIEAKAANSGSTQDGIAQLATWISAWHRRMQTLNEGAGSAGQPQTPLVSLPAVSIQGKYWRLCYAVDDTVAEKICMIQMPFGLGETSTVYQTYKLLATWRILLRWADGPFRTWWKAVVMPWLT